VARDGKIYIFGGNHKHNESTNTWTQKVQVYDCASNTWSYGSDMPSLVIIVGAVLKDDCAWVFGWSADGITPFPYVLKYAFATDQWTQCDFPVPASIEFVPATPVVCVENDAYLLDVHQGGGFSAKAFKVSMKQWLLLVQSAPLSGVQITGSYPGLTNYTVSCPDQSAVRLIAPATAMSGPVDYEFVRWSVDGVRGDDGVVDIQMTADTLATAEYRIVKRSLTVESLPSGLVITSEVAPGATPYAAPLDDEQLAELSAPATASAAGLLLKFDCWVLNGKKQQSGLNPLTVKMDANRAAVALYRYRQACSADANEDGKVNLLDLIYVRNWMGQPCSQ
jgi:hypothetical protein